MITQENSLGDLLLTSEKRDHTVSLIGSTRPPMETDKNFRDK